MSNHVVKTTYAGSVALHNNIGIQINDLVILKLVQVHDEFKHPNSCQNARKSFVYNSEKLSVLPSRAAGGGHCTRRAAGLFTSLHAARGLECTVFSFVNQSVFKLGNCLGC